MKRWIADVEEDRDGAYINLPQDLLDEVQWKEGDKIEWIDNKDGSWTMKKKEETELVLVEAVSIFRMRYVVEVPAGKAEWALDTVTCNDAVEFSQHHVGEEIVSHRVISREEAIRLCEEDNEYCKTWSDENKFKAFVTPIQGAGNE